MRSVHFLFSTVQFLFTTLILLLGGFFIGLHYAPHLRFAIGQIFIQNAEAFIPLGLSILGCGILLLLGFYAMNRGAYFRFSVSTPHTTVDAALIRAYIKKYLSDQFPESDLTTDVILHADQKLEIALQMPPLDLEAQTSFLEKTEKDLSQLLRRFFGYNRDFLLTIVVN